MIVSMAQHFVQEQFMAAGSGRHHVEFDLAYLHPQPEANYWASRCEAPRGRKML